LVDYFYQFGAAKFMIHCCQIQDSNSKRLTPDWSKDASVSPRKSKREAEGGANMNYVPGEGGMAESLNLQGFRRKKSDLLIIGKVICETLRRMKMGEFERWCD